MMVVVVMVIVITVMQGTMIKSISYGFCHAIIFIATYKTYACTIRELMSHRIFQIACMYALMVSGTSDFRHFFHEKKKGQRETNNWISSGGGSSSSSHSFSFYFSCSHTKFATFCFVVVWWWKDEEQKK